MLLILEIKVYKQEVFNNKKVSENLNTIRH